MSQFPEGTPTVTVELGGKSFQLGWTMAAMRRAKKLGVLDVDWDKPSDAMLAIPSVVWAAMSKADNESVTPDEVDEMVNPNNIIALMSKVTELFGLAEPDPVGNEHPAPQKKARAGQRSTSTNSGQSESTTSV